MAAPATPSSFDVAYWFIERALNEGEYLQPQKLHRVMFLSQAYYAVAYHRRLLMPAIFLAEETGPVEPNVLRACAVQRPPISDMAMPDSAIILMDSIWRRFGQHSTDYLNRMIAGHAPYVDAREQGPLTEITLASMISFYGKKSGSKSASGASNSPNAPPPVEEVIRPQTMRDQTGKPVSVQKWTPKGR